MNWRAQIDDFKKDLSPVEPSTVRPAIRMAFFGSVGSGKSVTAGICAIGISNGGQIGWVDGEAKRSGMAIDIVCEMAAKQLGGTKVEWLAKFKVIHLAPPFNPLRVIAAMEALEAVGCKTVILDCLTQAWEEDGGYLDMKEQEVERLTKGDDWKRDKMAMAAAAHVKPWTHGKLVSAINQSPLNLILLFQGKTRTTPKRIDGKLEIVTSDVETPIQESGLTRTAIAAGRVECRMNGDTPEGGFCFFRGDLNDGTKYTHPGVLKCLPKNGQQFRFSHGQALAKWIAGENESDLTPEVAPDPRTEAASSLWNLVKPRFHKRKDFQDFCQKEGLIDTSERIAELTLERLVELYGILEVQQASEANK